MSTKSDRFDLNGNPYDISAQVIHSRADMAGAQVFVIEGRIGRLRVLDFSEREAEETYREEVVENTCHECGELDRECCCEEDEYED